MNKILSGFKYIFDKNFRFRANAGRGRYNGMSDEKFLKGIFRSLMGEELKLDAPVTFNEKLQWLKLYNRRPEYTMMVDKYLVRDYISEKLGEEYLIPLLGVWDDPDDIDFDALPDKFVLKCNHNSGLGMCICKDKSKLNIDEVKKELRRGLKQDYYITGREWPYKDVPRKIIAEKYMEEAETNELRDYKFMCFDGKVECSFVCSERFTDEGLKVTFFDNDWNKMPFERSYPASVKDIQKPVQFELMKRFAEILSENIPFVRVDFYEVDGKVYFGEMTFFPGGGFESFQPYEWDIKLGDMIKLPSKNKI